MFLFPLNYVLMASSFSRSGTISLGSTNNQFYEENPTFWYVISRQSIYIPLNELNSTLFSLFFEYHCF